jgi:hypothetical protein
MYTIYNNYFHATSKVCFILSIKHLMLRNIHHGSKLLCNTITASQMVTNSVYTCQSDRITFAALHLAVLTYQQNSHVTSEPIPIEFQVNI